MESLPALLRKAAPSLEDIDRITYKAAEELRREMTRPGGQPEKLDFSVAATCFRCNMPILDRKPLVCSGCKSLVFCSKACHAAEWKNGRFGTQNHKFFCPKNKIHMQKIPLAQGILKQFPWGRIEKDGTFPHDFILAYYGVLGHEGFGYWSIPGGSSPHMVHSDICGPQVGDLLSVAPQHGYQHGYQLLHDKHLDDKGGWKLEDRLIPKLHFESGMEPAIASSVNVIDWKSWYSWRNLPLESPAALLMHYPLTVYQLLVHVLRITHPSRNSAEHRQSLNVHYLGPEVELNMLPLFSELALLLPYTDIKLTMYGTAVYNLVQQAKKGSVAMKAKRNLPVYTYTSPSSMGGSTLAIFLHGEHENWDPRVPSMTNNLPDAIVAANAGLLSYKGWQGVILYCHVEGTPFAVTEYAEQSAEVQVEAFPKILMHSMPYLQSRMNTAALLNLMSPRTYPIKFNPFQRPGQRYIGSVRLPNLSNGFTIQIVGNEKNEEVEGGPSTSGVLATGSTPSEVQQLVGKTKDMSLDGLD
ncbi:hypothetical protein EDD17DRAFT_1763396 [Pisolithus thermaeus]|nr:hypothetical protein EV401DRAFT_2065121 [Pisolithus croceorrhizus]KAI6158765.1 hypothetical protein EDD17DRAFT_1763396 [Pisolithus thermaeus]